MRIDYGSVCSGIEAASVAFTPLGWEAAWFSEIEPFPCAVLAHHYPSVPNQGDMTNLPALIRAGLVCAPAVFCGGTPCQAFSVAGSRRSLSDARGCLTLVFCDIADAIDESRLENGQEECVIFWENVPGVLNTEDNAFGCFLAQLAGEEEPLVPSGKKWTHAGAVFGPKRAVAWRVLDAQYFGLAQQRRRVFVVASAREGFDPAAVLFEREGVRRDSAPRREAGEGVAKCLTRGAAQRFDSETETMIPVTTHPLRGEGFDASEDGTGRGTPLVPVGVFQDSEFGVAQYDSAGTLRAGRIPEHQMALQPVAARTFTCAGCGKTISEAWGWGEWCDYCGHEHAQPVAFDTTQITSAANYSNPKPSDPCHPPAAGAHPPVIAFHPTQDPISRTDGTTHALGCGSSGGAATVAVAVALRGRDGGATAEVGDDLAFTLRASDGGGDKPHVLAPAIALQTDVTPKASIELAFTLKLPSASGGGQPAACMTPQLAVRRLTPRECERLQGFQWLCDPGIPGAWQDEAGRWWSPDYTATPWRKKPASECPDGPRYKALGNSWAVPVVRWIGERIHQQLAFCEALK